MDKYVSIHLFMSSYLLDTALDAIFERFYRGKKTHESVAGTGMGLSIARDIVRAHHGKLRVQNTPEGGAQFSFTVSAFHEDRPS
jgi:signal transduction histidine kinase